MRADSCAALKFCARENFALAFMWPMSAPAQKLLPAPSSTTARTLGSASSFLSEAVSKRVIAGSNALCTSGRFSMTVALPSASTRVMTSLLMRTLSKSGGLQRAIIPAGRAGLQAENLHAEHAEACGCYRGVCRRRKPQREHGARIARCDDAVIPQPRRSVVSARLPRVLFEDRFSKSRFVFGAPRSALFF